MSQVVWVVVAIAVVFTIVRKLLPVKGVTSIRAQDLQEKLGERGDNPLQLIDVRELSEYKSGHIQGFRNIPLGQVKAAAEKLDKDKEIVVMCRSGARSMQAAKILKNSGFGKVTNLSGGIMSWRGKTVK